MLMCKGLWFVMIKCLIVEGTLGLDSWFSSLSIFWPSRFHPWLGMTFFMCGLSHESPVYITFQTWRSHISQTGYIIFRTWRSQKFDPGYVIFPTWRTYKIKTGYVIFQTGRSLEIQSWKCHFPNMETILILERLFICQIWKIEISTIGCYVDPILDIVIFMFFQSWIQICARFGICLNPLWIFLDEPNLEKLHFFEIWILLETRKLAGENQIKSMLDFWSVSSAFKYLLITKDKIHVSGREKNE